jgi:methanol metabolism-related c-type cytochrome
MKAPGVFLKWCTGRFCDGLRKIDKDNRVKSNTFVGASTFAALIFSGGAVLADPSGDPAPVKYENGRYYDKAGNPTFKVQKDGMVDWATYSGFRRYHAECHVCHGPDAEGSTYAPALKDSLTRLSYPEFYGIVVGGRQTLGGGQEKVMPAFGDNKNVMCYIDDIYTYLRARADGAIGRGRPLKREDKDAVTQKAEDACLGQKD